METKPDCVCYECAAFKAWYYNNRELDCACDGGPVYCKKECDKCKFNNKCDVVKHKEDYFDLMTDNQDCINCTETECQSYRNYTNVDEMR